MRRTSFRIFRRAVTALGLLLIVQTVLAAQLCLSILGGTPVTAGAQPYHSVPDAGGVPCCSHPFDPVDCVANPYHLDPATPSEAPSPATLALKGIARAVHPVVEQKAPPRPPALSPPIETPIPIRLGRYLS